MKCIILSQYARSEPECCALTMHAGPLATKLIISSSLPIQSTFPLSINPQLFSSFPLHPSTHFARDSHQGFKPLFFCTQLDRFPLLFGSKSVSMLALAIPLVPCLTSRPSKHRPCSTLHPSFPSSDSTPTKPHAPARHRHVCLRSPSAYDPAPAPAPRPPPPHRPYRRPVRAVPLIPGR